MSQAEPSQLSDPPAAATPWFMRVARQLFAIDPRSAAAFRIGIAAILLCDLINRSLSLRFHYTDEGVVPRAYLIDHLGESMAWSLHMLGGGAGSQAVLFVIAGLAAIGLLVGYRTRTMALVSWVLLASLQARNPWVTNAGDGLLRVMVFWAMFLPLGRRWSIDALRQRGDQAQPLLSVATAAIMIQLCVMYVMTAVSKWNAVWHDGIAMDRVVFYSQYLKGTGYWLQDAPGLRWVLSVITPWMELLLPLVVWLPLATRWVRIAVIVMMVGFHIGIELTLTTGLFQYVAIVSWLLFVPAVVWERFPLVPALTTRVALRLVGPGERLQRSMGWPLAHAEHLRWVLWRCRAGQVLAGALLVWLLVWSVRIAQQDFRPRIEAPGAVVGLIDPLTGKPMSKAINVTDLDGFNETPRDWVDRIVRLNSSWRMFAHPKPRDGYHVIYGERADGTVVNLLEGTIGDPNVHYEEPEVPARLYPDHRWRKYFRTVSVKNGDEMRRPLGAALCRWWNRAHPEDPLQEVQVDFIERKLLDDGTVKRRRLVFVKVVCPRPGDVAPPDESGADGS